MKKMYESPLAEIVKFEAVDSIMDNETGIPDLTTSGSVEEDF